MENKDVIYFAHPIRTYATDGAREVLQELARVYKCKIIDPEVIGPSVRWKSCKQCSQEIMNKVFFPQIAKCTKFAIWPPLATCGIECELHEAWRLGKSIIHIAYQLGEIEFKEMTMQEYHDIKNIMERKK